MEQIQKNGLTETVLAGSPADRPWEGCINSKVYRVPRGIRVTIPLFLKEHIEATERERAAAERRARSWQNGLSARSDPRAQ